MYSDVTKLDEKQLKDGVERYQGYVDTFTTSKRRFQLMFFVNCLAMCINFYSATTYFYNYKEVNPQTPQILSNQFWGYAYVGMFVFTGVAAAVTGKHYRRAKKDIREHKIIQTSLHQELCRRTVREKN